MPALNNAKREWFCQNYILHENGAKAALDAGYSPKTARAIAYELLTKPDVDARIDELRADRAARLKLEADDVLRHWYEIAQADPNELIQHRTGACRYCWGVDNRYQWKTEREYQEACALAASKKQPEPDDSGGYGYRLIDDPNPECPECSGLGINYVQPLDTRNLSPGARLLFAGVKQTKDGLEIKMRDQDKALESVARHLGMFKDKVEHDISDQLAAVIMNARRRERLDD